MRLRIVICSLVALIMGGTLIDGSASAQGAGQDGDQACINKLAATESLVDQTVNSKALDEGDVEEVNMLLDEADAQCTDGDYKKAEKTLAKVKGMLKPPAAAATPAAQ